jgi:hypothetical protein
MTAVEIRIVVRSVGTGAVSESKTTFPPKVPPGCIGSVTPFKSTPRTSTSTAP